MKIEEYFIEILNKIVVKRMEKLWHTVAERALEKVFDLSRNSKNISYCS